VSAFVNPLGKRTIHTYDDARQQTKVLDPNSRRVTTVYDAAGQATASVDQLAKRTTFEYDNAGWHCEYTNVDRLGQ
jgi:uncharacterized protein RhaS with RHS repeats